MLTVNKFFNTAGPIKLEFHYNIAPLRRIEVDEIEMLIQQQKYFEFHAPRQTEKTLCLLALCDYLNAGRQYWGFKRTWNPDRPCARTVTAACVLSPK